MNVKAIKLIDFRGYKKVELSFPVGINYLVGNNGQGKTNMIEAIHYASVCKSFKCVDDSELINHNNEAAFIQLEVDSELTNNIVEVQVTRSGKKVLKNNKPITKVSDLNNVYNCIVFEPKDALFLKDLPRVRRSFVNTNISKRSDLYLKSITSYEKLLKRRNELLKKVCVDDLEIEVVTNQLVSLSEVIAKSRSEFVEKTNEVLGKVHEIISGKISKVELVYKEQIKYGANYKRLLSDKYKESYAVDKLKKTTAIGVHKEDIELWINNKNVAVSCSQGENRIAVLALKLSQYLLYEKTSRPIVVLDDVMSELDENHQKKLLRFLKRFEQVFITSTHELNCEGLNVYEIKDHKVQRRKMYG